MSSSLRLVAAGAIFAAAAAFAATPQTSYAATPPATSSSATKTAARTRTPQQQRMSDCSHQAKAEGKKGPERKTFMSTCLKGSHTAAASTSAPHKTKVKAETKADAEG